MRRAEPRRSRSGCCTGPVELLPVSSSGHVAARAVAARAGRSPGTARGARSSRSRCTRARRRALLVVSREPLRRPRPALLAAAVAPAGARRAACSSAGSRSGSGTPATLAAGPARRRGARWSLADRAPAGAPTRRRGLARRPRARPRAGVRARSRASRAAARRWPRPARAASAAADASRLSWEVALPVLVGASALKAWRVRPRDARQAARVGAAAAFASTLATARAIGHRAARARCGRGRRGAPRSPPPSSPCGTIGRDD